MGERRTMDYGIINAPYPWRSMAVGDQFTMHGYWLCQVKEFVARATKSGHGQFKIEQLRHNLHRVSRTEEKTKTE